MNVKHWMVMGEPGLYNGIIDRSERPRFVHQSRESAEKAAEELAVLLKEPFLILEVVAWVHPTKLQLSGKIIPVYEKKLDTLTEHDGLSRGIEKQRAKMLRDGFKVQP